MWTKNCRICTSINCLFNLRTDYQITQNIEADLLVEASVNRHPPPLNTSRANKHSYSHEAQPQVAVVVADRRPKPRAFL